MPYFVQIIDHTAYFADTLLPGYVQISELPVNFDSDKKYTINMSTKSLEKYVEIQEQISEELQFRKKQSAVLRSAIDANNVLLKRSHTFEFYNITLPVNKQKIEELSTTLFIKNNKLSSEKGEIYIFDIDGKKHTIELYQLETIVDELNYQLLQRNNWFLKIKNDIEACTRIDELNALQEEINNTIK